MDPIIQAAEQSSTLTSPIYDFSAPGVARHSVRVLCDEGGMSLTPNVPIDGKLYLWKDIICACIQIESGFNPKAFHLNKGETGVVWSTDYGICQINDYWNIGEGKSFPSSEFVLENPAICIQWMVKQFLAGNAHLWASYSSGEYKKFLPY